MSEKTIARSLILYPEERPINATGLNYRISIENSFKSLKKFTLNRTNAALNVGFDPYAPVAIRLPEITDEKLRLVMKANKGSGIKRIFTSSTPFVERDSQKNIG